MQLASMTDDVDGGIQAALEARAKENDDTLESLLVRSTITTSLEGVVQQGARGRQLWMPLRRCRRWRRGFFG